MEKLTEFVTNSFVDKEVKFLPTRSSPKLEPLSPPHNNNRCSSGSASRSSSVSASAPEDCPDRRIPEPQKSPTTNQSTNHKQAHSRHREDGSPTAEDKNHAKLSSSSRNNNNNSITISNQNRDVTQHNHCLEDDDSVDMDEKPAKVSKRGN